MFVSRWDACKLVHWVVHRVHKEFYTLDLHKIRHILVGPSYKMKSVRFEKILSLIEI